jgi:hypothetical protein
VNNLNANAVDEVIEGISPSGQVTGTLEIKLVHKPES